MRLILFASKERIIKMNSAEDEVWPVLLNVDGNVVSIDINGGDYMTGSDFLYARFQNFVKAGRHFEDLAAELNMQPTDLFKMLLEWADEEDIIDVLIDAYGDRKG